MSLSHGGLHDAGSTGRTNGDEQDPARDTGKGRKPLALFLVDRPPRTKRLRVEVVGSRLHLITTLCYRIVGRVSVSETANQTWSTVRALHLVHDSRGTESSL